MPGVKDIEPDNVEVLLHNLKGKVYVYNPSGQQTGYRIEIGIQPYHRDIEGEMDEYDCQGGQQVRIRNWGPARLQVLNLDLP